MMSNGPCSSRLSFQSGTRSMVAASTSSGVSSTKTCRKPSRWSPRSDRRSCDFWLRTTCGPKSRSARPAVALLAELLGQVEHDRHRQAVILPGQFHQRLAGLGLDVGGVDHREPPQGQPLPGDEPEHLERLVRDRLVVLVVADHPPAGVGREDLRGLEVPAGERALARAAGADQDDEAQLGDLDLHWSVNQPSSQVPEVAKPGLGEHARIACSNISLSPSQRPRSAINSVINCGSQIRAAASISKRTDRLAGEFFVKGCEYPSVPTTGQSDQRLADGSRHWCRRADPQGHPRIAGVSVSALCPECKGPIPHLGIGVSRQFDEDAVRLLVLIPHQSKQRPQAAPLGQHGGETVTQARSASGRSVM